MAGPCVLPYGESACTRGSIVFVSPQETNGPPQGQGDPCMRLGPLEWFSPHWAARGGRYRAAHAQIFRFVPQKGDKRPEKELGCS